MAPTPTRPTSRLIAVSGNTKAMTLARAFSASARGTANGSRTGATAVRPSAANFLRRASASRSLRAARSRASDSVFGTVTGNRTEMSSGRPSSAKASTVGRNAVVELPPSGAWRL